MRGKKDNYLLVEFDFVIDLDLAMFRLFKDKYSNSIYINKDLIFITDEKDIISILLNRNHINPLELLLPDQDSTSLYLEFMNNEKLYKDLLSYATPYDTFRLMITFLTEASSVDITILCKSKIEADYIKSLNPTLKTIIMHKMDVPMSDYTAMYIKYFVNATNYRNVAGKHIYIPWAKYNMDEEKDCVSIPMVKLFSSINEIHLIDPYTDVKYRPQRKEEVNHGDLL